NNVLFMATELLLLGAAEGIPLLLIEEPEAHLHPQMQLRLMELLELRSKPGSGRVQVLATTHSPSLAAKADIEAMTLLAERKTFPLAHTSTALERSDYAFLRRFLDVTKANLFFARAVIIVEGDAENLLLPALAEALGRPLAKYGVSVVNVGHRGLFRYSRIFQRSDGAIFPVRVACLADRDIPTAASAAYVPAPAAPTPGQLARRKFENDFTDEELAAVVFRLKARDGGSVRTFVSPRWTLEHDVAAAGLGQLCHRAIRLARRAKDKNDVLTDEEIASQIEAADAQFAAWQAQLLGDDEIAALIYQTLFEKRASKVEAAHYLAAEVLKQNWAQEDLARRLPRYLREAIEYVTEPLGLMEDVG
ncbi:MAG: TOPRIM nucleotidyl transferase/hydrolase domain-containing protein, partial [Nisaea sp.]|uniref:ATP-dependent nuclease n=1 Tax=Nisaea sp. TaxID=2024842 RepID=UPI00326767B4